jgi:hypothetical protein
VFLADTVNNSITVNLPAAAQNKGRWFTVKKTNALNIVTVDPSGGELIDGATTFVFTVLYQSVTVVCDGTGWWVI